MAAPMAPFAPLYEFIGLCNNLTHTKSASTRLKGNVKKLVNWAHEPVGDAGALIRLRFRHTFKEPSHFTRWNLTDSLSLKSRRLSASRVKLLKPQSPLSEMLCWPCRSHLWATEFVATAGQQSTFRPLEGAGWRVASPTRRWNASWDVPGPSTTRPSHSVKLWQDKCIMRNGGGGDSCRKGGDSGRKGGV